ncbi:MAG: tetratricopeptide repeat protein [Kofleriaceae bacterium]
MFALASIGESSEPRGQRPSDRIGRFELRDFVGSGSMGAVYRAHDPELDRDVAIKIRHARSKLDVVQEDRIRREAQALARLHEPNVVGVFETGLHDGKAYVVMEYVAGETLQAWMERPHPARVVVEMLVQAGRGLASAHAEGLVHRDFKPSNVLVSRAQIAKVGDFGLARLDAADRESAPSSPDQDSVTLTLSGALLGTPAYMAPEQLAGAIATEASDQFSFCVTLYEALYGRRPFAGASLGAIRTAMDHPITFPPRRGVPAHVRSALARGLSIDPAARFESMVDLLGVLGHRPRRRWLWAVAAVFIIAVGAGLLWMTDRESAAVCGGANAELADVWNPARRASVASAFVATKLPYADDQLARVGIALDRYTASWIRAGTRACEDTRVRKSHDDAALALRIDCLGDRKRSLRALVDVLSRADAGIVENAVDAVTKLPPLEQCDDVPALRELVRPHADPLVRAEVDKIAAELATVEALRDAGKSDSTLVAQGRALVERTRAIDYPPIRARGLFWLGILADDLEEVDEAERSFREVIAVADLARDDRMRANAWMMLVSLIAVDRGKPKEVVELLPQAEAAIARVGPDTTLAVDWLNARAMILNAEGNVRESAKLLEQVVAHKQNEEGDDPGLADALSNLAVVSGTFATPDETLALTRRATAIYVKAYGPNHPDAASAQLEEAVALMSLGKLDQAATLLESTIPIFEGAYGPDAPSVAMSLVRLASVYRRQKRLADAAAALDRVLAIRQKAYGNDHPLIAEVEQQLALVATQRGDHARAIELHRDSIRIVDAAMGPDHPFIGVAHFGIGQALRQSGKLAEALVEFERAHAIEEKALGKDSPKIAEALTLIGATKIALGDPKGAIPHLERAYVLRTSSNNSPADLAKIQLTLADALQKTGQRVRARTLAEQARDGYAELGDAKELAIANKLLETLK